MSSQSPRRLPAVAGAIVIAIAIGAAIYASSYLDGRTSQVGSTQTSTEATACSVSSQAGPFLLRILSDSNQTPVRGAQVMATNNPTFCGDSPVTTQTTLAFTTNGTEWYSLSGENNQGYSVVITFSGQTYTFTGRLQNDSVTCATYHIPSGITNITMDQFRYDCR